MISIFLVIVLFFRIFAHKIITIMNIPITKKEFRDKARISSSTFQRLMKEYGINTGHKNYLTPKDLEVIAFNTGINIR